MKDADKEKKPRAAKATDTIQKGNTDVSAEKSKGRPSPQLEAPDAEKDSIDSGKVEQGPNEGSYMSEI
jgi:hypothetical protein